MKVGKLVEDDWKRARIAFECEPTVKLSDIARSLSVTRGRVSQVAKKQRWKKQLDAAAIAGRAHEITVSKFTQSSAAGSKDAAVLNTNQLSTAPLDLARDPVRPTLPVVPHGMPEVRARAAVVDQAVDERANVEARHRSEHQHLLKLTYDAIKSKDLDAGKHAEVCTKTIERLQNLERRWWKLDEDSEKKITISINRTPGKTIGQ
jgi:hypothetical protein